MGHIALFGPLRKSVLIKITISNLKSLIPVPKIRFKNKFSLANYSIVCQLRQKYIMTDRIKSLFKVTKLLPNIDLLFKALKISFVNFKYLLLLLNFS
jgi:hypothetical protein